MAKERHFIQQGLLYSLMSLIRFPSAMFKHPVEDYYDAQEPPRDKV